MVVIVGGTIPGDDIAELKEAGVAEVFTPGASTQEIIDFVRGAVPTAEHAVSRAGSGQIDPSVSYSFRPSSRSSPP